MAGQCLDRLWIFDLAERDPERLLSMSDDEFRLAMTEAGLDVDELNEQFELAVAELFARLGDFGGA